jgi:RNA polymerase sigma factor (TIGR02999 family)
MRLLATPTQLLSRAADGDDKAISQLMPLVYDELRRLAASYLRRERPGQTLQATALVHEAYVRLISEKAHNWRNRTHFLAIAALSMRQILVQRARSRRAAKRGGDPARVTLDEQVLPAAGHGVDEIDLVALDAALDRLASLNERQAKIVELRYFGGLGVEEAAEALGISPATVKRDWTLARAWLKRELTGADER